MATKKQTTDVEILDIAEGSARFCVLGSSPLIFNRMSEKAKRSLIDPVKKTKAAQAATAKHDVYAEFRDSAGFIQRPDAPTLLAMPVTVFKRALAAAALDMQGSGISKSKADRLCYAPGEQNPIWGLPSLMISVVRNSDPNHTPDLRTRAVIEEWATYVQINFAMPMMTHATVAGLLAAAGYYNGVGDWRPQKGSGAYGRFRLVNEDDPDFQRIIQTSGRAVQIEAMLNPSFYDAESEEIYTWWDKSTTDRGASVTKPGEGEAQLLARGEISAA